VTQDGPVPGGNDSTEEVAERAWVGRSDRIDAWMELEQPPVLEPVADLPGTEPGRQELPPRHNPVL